MGDSRNPPKRFVPEPVETSTKSRRGRIPPKAVESSTLFPGPKAPRAKSSFADQDKDPRSTPRSFAPIPVETTQKSNRSKETKGNQEPVGEDRSSSADARSSEPVGLSSARKFAPVLLETSRRSRRSTDEEPNLLSGDRTEGVLEDEDEFMRRRSRRRSEHGISPSGIDLIRGSRSGSSPLRQERSPVSRTSSAARQHSFRIPALEPIESSESEKSNELSLSTSQSASPDSGTNMQKRAKKMRESCDDGTSGYLLQLAAKAAENQLREQALAAFPNDDFHQQVDHFAVDRESDESERDPSEDALSRRALDTVATSRRDSENDLASELRQMRQQKEKAQEVQHPGADQHGPTTKIPAPGTSTAPQVAQAEASAKHLTAAAAGLTVNEPKNVIGGWQKNAGLQPMKNAATPPMLGQDIKFRMSKSPQPTTLNADHGPGFKAPQTDDAPGTPGLWMGYCFVKGGQATVSRKPQLGLKTPAVEKSDPFSALSFDDVQDGKAPQSPPARSNSQPTSPVLVITSEEDIDREFPDAFVTQVYNYLSLGFPSLAGKFDDELSKISLIPIDELRSEDHDDGARGFVGLEDGKGRPVPESDDAHCGRWKALRKYIREWARQNPELASDGLGFDAWGVRARRGSWAL